MNAAACSLSVDGLAVGYGRGQVVLDDFSWRLESRRTILLGPNGAGKSTLLKAIVGVIRPSAGRVNAPGAIGYMPQTIRAVHGLTVLEQVEYVAWLKGVRRSETRREAMTAVDKASLVEQARTRASSLSGGQLRRVGLAQALVGSPSLLLLDEPTAGLDPAQRMGFSEVVQNLDCSVVVATHQIDDIAETYDHVGILAGGRLVFDDSLSAFLAEDPSGRSSATAAYITVTEGLRRTRHVG